MISKTIVSNILTLTILLSFMVATKSKLGAEIDTQLISTEQELITLSKRNKFKSIIDELEKQQHERDEEYKKRKDQKNEDNGIREEPENPENDIKLFFVKYKQQMINTMLAVVGLALIILISYKMYTIKQAIKEQKSEITSYADQLEQIIEGTDRLVFSTWKDQREGIKFVDNVAFKKIADKELTKAQKIQAEIEKVEEDIRKKQYEISSLREKEIYYIDEISKLEEELANGKTQVLDEGAALGFAETVLREFK